MTVLQRLFHFLGNSQRTIFACGYSGTHISEMRSYPQHMATWTPWSPGAKASLLMSSLLLLYVFYYYLSSKYYSLQSNSYVKRQRKESELEKAHPKVNKEMSGKRRGVTWNISIPPGLPKAQRIAAEREMAYVPFVPQAVLPSR
ncbi:hypothetical protein Tco_1073140 [Tanacetum coccineum]